MASESPRLVRSLFGYRTSDVRQMLADRERMFLLVQSEAGQARAKADRVQSELDAVRAKLHEQAELSDAMLTRAQTELDSTEEALRARSEEIEAAELRATALTAELETARGELRAARAELQVTNAQAQAAEARTSDVRDELAAARAELTAARSELAEREQGGTTSPLATEELSVILEAAETGMSGIMERTRSAYEAQLAQAERERQAIRSEIDRFADWQEHVEPQVRSIQQSIERASDRIIRVPHQIQEAVGSMVEAIASVSDSLARLASLPGPLSAPEEPPHAPEHPPVPRIDVIRLHDDRTSLVDAGGEPESEPSTPVNRGDRDEPSTRTEDVNAIGDGPHSAHSVPWKRTGER
jgi:predicted  nucleic acid-binding Zn-ribbon protein